MTLDGKLYRLQVNFAGNGLSSTSALTAAQFHAHAHTSTQSPLSTLSSQPQHLALNPCATHLSFLHRCDLLIMPSKISKRNPRRRETDLDIDDEVASWDSLSNASSSGSRSSSSSSSSSDGGLTSKLPTLPDLRFEQSYLATIRNFLHEDPPSSTSQDDSPEFNEKQDLTDEKEQDHHHEVEITRSNADKEGHELWLGNLRVEL